jgi:hypothetical protein
MVISTQGIYPYSIRKVQEKDQRAAEGGRAAY